MYKKFCVGFFICLFSLGALLSCGLEAFYYIDYIPQGDYRDTSSVIWLPSSSTDGYGSYFTNFVIFYRIYSSSESIPTGMHLMDSVNDRAAINSALNADYTSFLSLTDITSTTVNTSNLETTFYNRRYFKLTLEGRDIDSVLSSQSLGGMLEIAFPPNNGWQPTLTINGNKYTLQRAKDGPSLLFTPKPNRYFLNHPDLYNNANITNELNADVASNFRADVRYSYVSMYVAAVGVSLEMPPRTIYSQPTFIGIFMLADWS